MPRLFMTPPWLAPRLYYRCTGLCVAQVRRHVRRKGLDECGIHFWGASENVSALRVCGSDEGADASTGLLDEQRAGRRVPGAETDFPEGIDAAAGDISEIQRGGAGPAHASRLAHDRAQHRKIGIHVAGVRPIRKTRRHEGSLQCPLPAHADAAVVEVCAG